MGETLKGGAVSRFTPAGQALRRWLIAVGAAVLTASVLSPGDLPRSAGALFVTKAATAAAASYLLMERREEGGAAGSICAFVWGMSVTLVAVAVGSLWVPYPLPWATATSEAAGAGVIVFVLWAATSAVENQFGDAWSARCVVQLALAICASAPLWLGPAAEKLGHTLPLADLAVAASPLTYLAVLAHYDYLRSPWFYEHCSIGSLRYTYATALGFTVSYAALGCVCLALGSTRRRKRFHAG